MNIREIKLDDAENFVQLIKEVEKQADFMLYGAGERNITAEKQRKQLEVIKNHRIQPYLLQKILLEY
ncbi:hypothetical protein [Bacillus sp. FJAT-25509]|uniref:hypothetical protein n=1 Tax=Bacillus sp. FJAT-25509 TaxID=1712029 RepID=UPI000AF20F6E